MTFLKWIGIFFLVVLLALVVSLLLHNLTPPTFRVRQDKGKGGGSRLNIRANFVVNSIYGVEVGQQGHTLISRKGFRGRNAAIDLPADIEKGTKLDITCVLQFDRWVSACGTTVTKQIVIE